MTLKKSISQTTIGQLLSRGISQIIVRESVAKKLSSGKRLRIKLGIDPTAPHLHIGHAIYLRKMKELQDLGHQIIFLVGDFTARIGDPSEKTSARKQLTQAQIDENMKLYKAEAGKILDLTKTEIRHNSEWYHDMDFAELFDLTSYFTVQQILERDMFQVRLKNKKPIWLHEFMYPIMQGYDSVALKADIEFGGNDQTFNMLAARTIQPHYAQDPQDVITFQLLEGTDGREKMSMSMDNTINIADSPKEMYGKTMSISDNLIVKYFQLVTDVSEKDIQKFEQEMKKGTNPRGFKDRLAKEIVGMFHSKAEADAAAKEFTRMFSEKKTPEKIPSKKVVESYYQLVDLLVELQLASSKSEARRLAEQGAVSIDGKVLKDWQKKVAIKSGMVVRVGKRKFVRVTK